MRSIIGLIALIIMIFIGYIVDTFGRSNFYIFLALIITILVIFIIIKVGSE